MVGSLSESAHAKYGQLLGPYLLDPANLFVISSDFCHWGDRFGFTHYDHTHKVFADSIEALDRQGMQLIEAQHAAGYASYLGQCHNTIFGRHPIAVLLHALDAIKAKATHTCKFVQYAQSNRVQQPKDSSVSYASAVISIAE